MNPASEDIKDRLVDQSVGTFATDLFMAEMPEDVNGTVICVYDTGGFAPAPNQIHNPSFMVAVRAEDYLTGYAKAEEVINALHELANTTINSTKYLQIWLAGDIIYIGKDSKERHEFTINFNTQRTPT